MLWIRAALLSFLLAGSAAAASEWGALEILGDSVPGGERRDLLLVTGETFAGGAVSAPVVVLRGTEPGPALCLVAGIHGDELNGVEIVRRVLETVDPARLSGTLIGVPIANVHGFRRSSRYLPDRRDLNRYFPGRPQGSAASRIAHRLFEGVIRDCDALVDFHTGSFHRTNLPQVRADLRRAAIRELADRFGAGVVLHSVGTPGILRRAAAEAGVAAITYEAGHPMEVQEDEVARGVEGALRAVAFGPGTIGASPARAPVRVFHRSSWVRSDHGGILFAGVALGDPVAPGDVLGTVTDPITNDRATIESPHRGYLIGMAVNQVVMPGFAAFHVGLESDGGGPGLSDEGDWEDLPFDPLDEPFEIDERGQ